MAVGRGGLMLALASRVRGPYMRSRADKAQGGLQVRSRWTDAGNRRAPGRLSLGLASLTVESELPSLTLELELPSLYLKTPKRLAPHLFVVPSRLSCNLTFNTFIILNNLERNGKALLLAYSPVSQ